MREINEQIKTRSFKNVYLLYGGEAYLRRQCRDNLVKAMIQDDDTMNMSHFAGKGIDEKEIMALADTMPFFADYRLVVVENSGFFEKGSHDELVAYMNQIPETTCLIFVEDSADKRNKLYKAVAANGYVTSPEMPKDKQLIQWLAGMAKKEHKMVRADVLNYFLQIVEQDMNMMKNEMEKLICYVGEREEITIDDVDAICSVYVENKIYDMVRAIAEKNQKKALQLYDDLVTLKEAPMRILYLIIKQFDLLHQIKILMEEGYSISAISDKLGIKSFIARKNAELCREFKSSTLREAILDGITLEESYKTGKITDRLAVEWMILKYSR